MRCICLATSPSMPGRMRSRNSTTVTSDPRRRQTEPSSSPMTPAPTTSSFFGGTARLRAPVDETTVFSSISTPGSCATSEPVAMTIALASSVVSSPFSALTITLPGAAIRPCPAHPVDLVLLEQERDAVDVGGDGVVLMLHHGAEIELRRPDDDPEGPKTVRRLVEHLGGVEERLGRDAADVEAGSAQASSSSRRPPPSCRAAPRGSRKHSRRDRSR